jgi:hypothetical protein
MTMSSRLWRVVTVLVRLDIAASIAVAAALYLWMVWH